MRQHGSAVLLPIEQALGSIRELREEPLPEFATASWHAPLENSEEGKNAEARTHGEGLAVLWGKHPCLPLPTFK